MKSKIHVAHWLLTRRCNLKCSYCAVVKDYENLPDEYPKQLYYKNSEMSTDYIIDTLAKLKKHNSDMFHIFFGGEPLLRNDLAEILSYCNSKDIYYTVITNNSEEIQPKIAKLIKKVGFLRGLTASIDPLILDKSVNKNTDRYKKSIAGLERLKSYKGVVEDLVAEITADNDNIDYLYPLVKMLTDLGVCSSITPIDIAKNKYYDFSNIRDESLLIQKTSKLKDVFQKIIDDGLNVHMADTMLPKLWDILPAELDCGLDKNVHNMTIESDGTVRLCLRIKGIYTPKLYVLDVIDGNGDVVKLYESSIGRDKNQLCEGCNWTCPISSSIVKDDESNTSDLLHTNMQKK